jgi:hypothetical protein
MSRSPLYALLVAAGLAAVGVGTPASAQTVNVALGDTVSVDAASIINSRRLPRRISPSRR